MLPWPLEVQEYIKATLVTANLPKLFGFPCLSFYIYPLGPSDSGINVLQCRHSCFQLSVLQNKQPGIHWCCLVAVCGLRSFSDVFQHNFDTVFYCLVVDNANCHDLSEIILQFKLRKFTASNHEPMSEGTVAASPRLVKRELICISEELFGTIASLK